MAKILTILKQELHEIIPPTLFFLITFSLLMITKRLISLEYGIPWTGFGMAVIGALLIGKAVLIIDNFPFVNKFPEKPLIYNVVWKFLLYFIAAIFLRYLEHIVPFLWKHETFIEAHRHLVEEIVWPHFWMLMMWVGVLLFIYCAMRELVRAIGREKVIQLFFGGQN